MFGGLGIAWCYLYFVTVGRYEVMFKEIIYILELSRNLSKVSTFWNYVQRILLSKKIYMTGMGHFHFCRFWVLTVRYEVHHRKYSENATVLLLSFSSISLYISTEHTASIYWKQTITEISLTKNNHNKSRNYLGGWWTHNLPRTPKKIILVVTKPASNPRRGNTHNQQSTT